MKKVILLTIFTFGIMVFSSLASVNETSVNVQASAFKPLLDSQIHSDRMLAVDAGPGPTLAQRIV